MCYNRSYLFLVHTSRHKCLICLLNAAENCDFNYLVLCTRHLFYLDFRIFPGPYSVKNIRNSTNCQHIPQYPEVVVQTIDSLSLLGARYVTPGFNTT